MESVEPGIGNSDERHNKGRAFGAFPPDLFDSVESALEHVYAGELEPSLHPIGLVIVEGVRLDIPSRVYWPEPPAGAAESLDAQARLILACLYTRHHDGRVRERWLPHLYGSEEPWVPPFVIQLLGEYVVEIAEMIVEHLPDLSPVVYRRFAAENPAYLDLTCARAVSYWDCYYRRGVHRNGFDLSKFPNFQALDALGLWVSRHGSRLLMRRDADDDPTVDG